MKATVILLFLVLPSFSFSQTVNNIAIKDIDVEYIEFYALRKAFGGSTRYLYIDYGQQTSVEIFARPDESKVKDDNGNEIRFNSEIDCLNFMVKNGYELISNNERISGDSSYPVFLMRKIKIEKKN
jgi:ABC-type sulfate transport system substrate-binding protein